MTSFIQHENKSRKKTTLRFTRNLAFAIAAFFLVVGIPSKSPALRLEKSDELIAAEVIASGLSQPAGMASDPRNQALYVAERGANRISLIHKRKVIPILENDFEVKRDFPSWCVSPERPMSYWTHPGLREPADLAIDEDGRMYVAEAGAGGRLLQFEPMSDGLMLANVLPTPWFETSRGYSSITVDANQKLYVTARESDTRGAFSFGSVLMRNTAGQWFLVDYGPFADFSNVAVDRKGETLVVGDSRRGDLSWYDVAREAEMASGEQLHGLRHVALMPDGRTLTTMERDDGTWSLVEADPLEGTIREWVGGLSAIGGLYVDQDTEEIYLSLRSEGKIMRLRKLDVYDNMVIENELERLTSMFELEKAIPPREWPEFFRPYVERLDIIQTVNPSRNATFTHKASSGEGDAAGQGKSDSQKLSMTMDEFASTVPIVAAKLKAKLLSDPSQEKDPIVELSFLLLYPNQTVVTDQTMAPSVSLFRATHQSGRVVYTRFMPNRKGQPVRKDMPVEDIPDVMVSFPMGYYAPEASEDNPALVRTYFLGMGMGSDYWIDIDRRNPDQSQMKVEKMDGTKLVYAVEPFKEESLAGGQSILVAGVKSLQKGWNNLGTHPVSWSLIDPTRPPLPTKHWVDIMVAGGRSGGIQIQPSLASAYMGDLTEREINLRRKIVMRAAATWKEIFF